MFPGLPFALAAAFASPEATPPPAAQGTRIFTRAVELQKAGPLGDAIPGCPRFLAWQPRSVGAHSSLGAALAAEGRYAEATEEYQEALRLDEANASADRNP